MAIRDGFSAPSKVYSAKFDKIFNKKKDEEFEKRNWQDIMIEHFGKNWAKDNYSIIEVGLMCETILKLEKKEQ